MVYWYYSQVGTCTDDNYLVTRFFLLPGVSISLIEQLPACLVKLVAVQISVVHGQPKKNNGQRERKKTLQWHLTQALLLSVPGAGRYELGGPRTVRPAGESEIFTEGPAPPCWPPGRR